MAGGVLPHWQPQALYAIWSLCAWHRSDLEWHCFTHRVLGLQHRRFRKGCDLWVCRCYFRRRVRAPARGQCIESGSNMMYQDRNYYIDYLISNSELKSCFEDLRACLPWEFQMGVALVDCTVCACLTNACWSGKWCQQWAVVHCCLDSYHSFTTTLTMLK